MLLSYVPAPDQPIMVHAEPFTGPVNLAGFARLCSSMTRGRIDRMAGPVRSPSDPGPDDGWTGDETTGLPDPGTREQFDDFYRREFPRMATLACAVSGSRLVAEDIAQDAMIEARNRWETIGSYDKPGAWVRRVTIQLASKRLRRARAETAALLRVNQSEPIPPGPEDVEDVLRAISRLPRRQRAAITLCYLEDQSVREIAEILGCAEGTVKAHLHKARTSLARMLTEGITR
jgi:RNA polymerase sigma-70 factor (ECF subfamily)